LPRTRSGSGRCPSPSRALTLARRAGTMCRASSSPKGTSREST
jgi:hypothetical protein